ncbi:hypothetical protein LPJ66_004169 [Kickxella alabastrina]|uniref:Uncharacterized protein n=1 Tax=Kickxella alabastrina TaxID=61397 RepID=A0ACC1IHR8_9FUNG|nr:hypothetical protein LPJ66_004169 [Kickxella alabastrina]
MELEGREQDEEAPIPNKPQPRTGHPRKNRIPSRGENTSKKRKAISRRTNTSYKPNATADNDSAKNGDKKRRTVKCSACSGRHYKKTGCDASAAKRGPLPTAN